jgi:hypothetical protein
VAAQPPRVAWGPGPVGPARGCGGLMGDAGRAAACSCHRRAFAEGGSLCVGRSHEAWATAAPLQRCHLALYAKVALFFTIIGPRVRLPPNTVCCFQCRERLMDILEDSTATGTADGPTHRGDGQGPPPGPWPFDGFGEVELGSYREVAELLGVGEADVLAYAGLRP